VTRWRTAVTALFAGMIKWKWSTAITASRQGSAHGSGVAGVWVDHHHLDARPELLGAGTLSGSRIVVWAVSRGFTLRVHTR
jgi:hypothetical protein